MPESTFEICAEYGNDDLAKVFVAKISDPKDCYIEFLESVQRPVPREKKWVLIVSTLAGCPVKCLMCDANAQPGTRLSFDTIMRQIDYLITRRYPDRNVPVEKFKVQFARMGDPALNPAVLYALSALPTRYNAPGLLPCISTVAPKASADFLDKLIEVKNQHYSGGRFQMQFSVHSTSERERDLLMPLPKLSLAELGEYGERFYAPGDRKITLNFAPAYGFELSPLKLRTYFKPELFLIKLTPINPTRNRVKNALTSVVKGERPESAAKIVEAFERAGYEVLLSIGDLEENDIMSNCGQFATQFTAEAGSPCVNYMMQPDP